MELLPSSRARVEITVPSSGGRARPGLPVHRTRRLGPDEVAVIDGIPCTSWARTVVDASSVLGRNAMRAVLRESEVLGLFDLHALTAALAGARGRRGVATLAALIQTAATESAMTRSVLEDSFLELCAVHGLPRPEVNVRVHGHEVDFLFRPARLVVETDGHAFHRSRDAFELDRRRDARLMLAGYRVLRLTWSQVEREGADVARTLRRLGVSIRPCYAGCSRRGALRPRAGRASRRGPRRRRARRARRPPRARRGAGPGTPRRRRRRARGTRRSAASRRPSRRSIRLRAAGGCRSRLRRPARCGTAGGARVVAHDRPGRLGLPVVGDQALVVDPRRARRPCAWRRRPSRA